MSRKYQSPEPSFLKRALKWVFVLGIWGFIILGCVIAFYARELPSIIRKPQFEHKASITVLANDGSVIGRYGDIKGDTVSVKELPPHLVDAILSIEDRRFYYHYGVDPIGLVRAVFVNLIHRDVKQGGSTITQQLAKNLFLSQEKTYKRKIQEAMLAVWLEHELTKEEILSAYLNRVYMGAGTYGVDAAAHVYFNKPAKELNLGECAKLAGLLRAPSRYSPLNNPQESEKRAKVVLGAMVDNGKITKKEAQNAFKKSPSSTTTAHADGSSSRYFADWVVDNLDDLIGKPEADIVVKTTLDPEVQSGASAVIATNISEKGAKLRISQGASIVLRPDGSIVAMVGGADYQKSQYNRAGQGMRQPGSSFKPIVYLAALESGWDQFSQITDEPFSVGSYHPQNFGNKYFGTVTLTDALTMSMNSVSVQLANAVGVDHVINVARRMGITATLDPNLALALGSSEVPMLEMAQVYATIASGGYAVKGYGINEVREEKTGKLLYQHVNEAAPKVFRDRDIGQLTAMMQSVVQYGTGQGAGGPYFAAGKTGTTQDHRDAWFDGFTNDYIAVVWFGNDDNQSMKAVTGGSISARAWHDIITAAKADPTPSKYNLQKTDTTTDEFSNMMSNIMNEKMPDGSPAPQGQPQNGRLGLPTGYQVQAPTGRFTPDHPGDRVGYDRMND